MRGHLGMRVGTHQSRAEAVTSARSAAAGAALPRGGGTTGTQHRMMPSADGIERMMFAGDEEFSQVFSGTISKSLMSLSCFA